MTVANIIQTLFGGVAQVAGGATGGAATGVGDALQGTARLIEVIKGKSPEDAAKLAQIAADANALQEKYKSEFDAQQELDDAQSRHDQVEVDKIEAAASGTGFWGAAVAAFKSCWRPAVGWVCVFGFLMAFLRPLIMFFTHRSDFPELSTDLTRTMLEALLGLGAYRSFDKRTGTSK